MAARFLEGLGMTCGSRGGDGSPHARGDGEGGVDGDGRFVNRPYGERRREGNKIPRLCFAALGMTCGWGRGMGPRMREDTERGCGWGRAVREPPLRGEEV